MNKIKTLLTIALLACAQSALAAQDNYVAVLHVLTAEGEYQKNILEDTQHGVSKAECELRLKAWQEKHGKYFEMAAQVVRDSGRSSAHRAECVKKADLN